MMRRIIKKKAQVTKSFSRFAGNDFHLPKFEGSFRDFWGRQTQKGRVEAIATIAAGLLAGLIFILAMFR